MHTLSGKLGKAGLLRRAGCMAAMMWLALGCARAELEPRTAVEVVVPAHFQRIVDRLSSRFADRPYERYSSEQVLRIAEAMLQHQNEDGGWPKNVDYLRVLPEEPRDPADRPGGRRSTLDNDATVGPLVYLAEVYRQTQDQRIRNAVQRGLAWVLRQQHPVSGGWRGADAEAVTFNDDAMTMVLHLLLDVERGDAAWAWLDEQVRADCAAAWRRGLACVLACQVRVDGEKTAWGQQHSHTSLELVGARSYELPGLTARESVGVVRLLMRIDPPGPEVIASVESAIRWFDRSRIRGYRMEDFLVKEGSATQAPQRDRRLVADTTAPDLWARYYEPEGNRPFFANRDGQKVYRYEQVLPERRAGYEWLGTWPAGLLATEYPAWAARHGRPNVLKPQTPRSP